MSTTLPSGQNSAFEAGRSDASARATGGRTVLRTAGNYLEAQAIVDRLSDGGFPVEHTSIVGQGVRIVEDVTGRMTTGRSAGRGALGGLWFGLLLGLLFGLFLPGAAWLAVVLTSLAFGAAWGAIFGLFGHIGTGGRRDFASTSRLDATEYDVTVDADFAARAEQVLSGAPASA